MAMEIELKIVGEIIQRLRKSIQEMENMTDQKFSSDKISGFVDGINTSIAIIRRNFNDELSNK